MMYFKEYQDVFKMSMKERRDYLKDKPDDYKKKYFQYDNRERSKLNRLKNKTKNDNTDTKPNITISHDPLLNSNPSLFKEKIDEMFKNAKIDARNSNSNIDIVNEVINNPPAPVIIQQPINPEPITPPEIIPDKTDDNIVDDGVFCKKVVYADLIIAKDFVCEGEDDEQVSPDTIKQIKNYNIKIPVSYLNGVYINLPNNNNSKMICDTEYIYIFFK